MVKHWIPLIPALFVASASSTPGDVPHRTKVKPVLAHKVVIGHRDGAGETHLPQNLVITGKAVNATRGSSDSAIPGLTNTTPLPKG